MKNIENLNFDLFKKSFCSIKISYKNPIEQKIYKIWKLGKFEKLGKLGNFNKKYLILFLVFYVRIKIFWEH